MTNNFEVKSLQTPTAAKSLAIAMAAACYNDEIRAILAAELLKTIARCPDHALLGIATEAASKLAIAYDRQYQD